MKVLKDFGRKFLKNPRQHILEPGAAASALRRQNFLFMRGQTLFKRLEQLFFRDGFKLSVNYSGRSLFMGSTVGVLIGLILGRYAYLSLLPSDMRNRLRNQASRQFETELTLAPPRAQITDRNGRTLAVSVLYPSIFVLPKRLPKNKETLREVAQAVKVPLQTLLDLSKSKKGFSWLKRQLTPAEFAKYGDLTEWHDFLGVVDEPKRLYPEKELASHLIGFVGVDNLGLEGVESVYNSILNGKAVSAKVTRDARGHITLITPNGAVKPEPSTPPIKLSIDISIQSFAESALKDGVIKARAHGGSAVVMDVETGEVLAMASYPTYDLNDPPQNAPERRRNRPVMDALELGSVMKPMVISRAIDLGVVKATDHIFCENGRLQVPGGTLHDDHPHGLITIGEVIKFSSNICTYKIVQKMGRSIFRDTILKYGLARWPGTGLPGEWSGRISQPDTWREMRFANMAFGQGIAISPLQLTRAYASLTGTGEDVSIKILAAPENAAEPEGPRLRIVSEATSRTVTEMMQSVVEEEGGTGRKASIPGVTVAGKTGTAQKFSSQTKSYSERIATFAGVAPSEKPKLAITVVIDEPQVRPAYGGTLAGPVFAEIGTKTIQYLNATGLLALQPSEPQSPLAQKEHKH